MLSLNSQVNILPVLPAERVPCLAGATNLRTLEFACDGSSACWAAVEGSLTKLQALRRLAIVHCFRVSEAEVTALEANLRAALPLCDVTLSLRR